MIHDQPPSRRSYLLTWRKTHNTCWPREAQSYTTSAREQGYIKALAGSLPFLIHPWLQKDSFPARGGRTSPQHGNPGLRKLWWRSRGPLQSFGSEHGDPNQAEIISFSCLLPTWLLIRPAKGGFPGCPYSLLSKEV